MSITKSLSALFAAGILSMSGAAIGTAQEAAPAVDTQVAVDQNTGEQRSAVPTNDGLKLNTQPGDTVKISDGKAIWQDDAGNLVAEIELTAEAEGIDFSYDSASSTIKAQSPTSGDGEMATASRCMPKWIGWAYNIVWGGLVCLPASVGVSGIATPIAGAVTAAACEAAGGALTTAVSC